MINNKAAETITLRPIGIENSSWPWQDDQGRDWQYLRPSKMYRCAQTQTLHATDYVVVVGDVRAVVRATPATADEVTSAIALWDGK